MSTPFPNRPITGITGRTAVICGASWRRATWCTASNGVLLRSIPASITSTRILTRATRDWFSITGIHRQHQLIRIIQQVQPDEIYNLGAQSYVAVSFESPEYTANSDALGTLRILEAVRILGLTDKTRLPGKHQRALRPSPETPQKESTPFYPRSPCGVAKSCLLDHG